MSGGVDRLRIDGINEYIGLRRGIYDVNLAPLPSSLSLSANEKAMNRKIDWRPRHTAENALT
jgi:hypothetical protein